jgi:hypothetical protein
VRFSLAHRPDGVVLKRYPPQVPPSVIAKDVEAL